MTIISADNELHKFCQFIKKDSGEHLSVESYNLDTGEGLMAGTQQEKHSRELGIQHRIWDLDKQGNVLKSSFNDKDNIRVRIQIPSTQYLNKNIREQVFELSSHPEYADRLEIWWSVEGHSDKQMKAVRQEVARLNKNNVKK